MPNVPLHRGRYSLSCRHSPSDRPPDRSPDWRNAEGRSTITSQAGVNDRARLGPSSYFLSPTRCHHSRSMPCSQNGWSQIGRRDCAAWACLIHLLAPFRRHPQQLLNGAQDARSDRSTLEVTFAGQFIDTLRGHDWSISAVTLDEELSGAQEVEFGDHWHGSLSYRVMTPLQQRADRAALASRGRDG